MYRALEVFSLNATLIFTLIIIIIIIIKKFNLKTALNQESFIDDFVYNSKGSHLCE